MKWTLRQPVELGDHEPGASEFGMGQGLGQLGAVGPLAGLDLLVGTDDHGALARGERLDRGDLAFQAQAALPLLGC